MLIYIVRLKEKGGKRVGVILKISEYAIIDSLHLNWKKMFEIEKQSIKGKWCGLVLIDIDFKFIDRDFFSLMMVLSLLKTTACLQSLFAKFQSVEENVL